MSYEFEIDHANGILIVQHHGTLNEHEAFAARGEVVPLLLKHGIRKILIDLRDARIEASATQIFEFQSTQSQEFPLGTRFAMVLSSESWAEEDVQFAVNVATNRGLIERTFTDREEAVSWLSGIRSEGKENR